MKYCTYLTIYSGNKLPPFYIGYSTVIKVTNRGYHGSVGSIRYKDIWRQELKTSPHLFKTKILKVFLSMNEAKEHEYKLLKAVSAHKNPLYINMGIMGKHLYFDRTGIPHTQETLELLRQRPKGKHTPESKRKIGIGNTGKVRSDEAKKRIGKCHKGKVESPETRLKKSLSRTGKKHSPETLDKLSTNSGRAVATVIDGIHYASKKKACAAIYPNLPQHTAMRYLNKLLKN